MTSVTKSQLLKKCQEVGEERAIEAIQQTLEKGRVNVFLDDEQKQPNYAGIPKQQKKKEETPQEEEDYGFLSKERRIELGYVPVAA